MAADDSPRASLSQADFPNKCHPCHSFESPVGESGYDGGHLPRRWTSCVRWLDRGDQPHERSNVQESGVALLLQEIEPLPPPPLLPLLPGTVILLKLL